MSLSSLVGITAQSEKFPVRFIVDLLNKQQRIVLTGECVKLWYIIAAVIVKTDHPHANAFCSVFV